MSGVKCQMSGVNRRGFTLVEIIIYLAIIGLIVTGLIAFSLSIADARNEAYVASEVQANGRTALDLMAQKIRLAKEVRRPPAGTTDNILVLIMPDLYSYPTITFSVDENGVLNLIPGSGDPVAITSSQVKVSELTFTNLAIAGERDNIKIEMTLEYNSDSADVEYIYAQSLETAVSVRQ